jgi:uncharacterized protein YbjT (DUF2867 family)
MKLVIFGGSRGIGAEAARAATAASHQVTVFARGSVPTRPNSKVVQGDVRDEAAVRSAAAGQDAVLCTLGVKPWRPSRILSEGTEQIIRAMKQAKVKRLLCITAIGTGDSRPDAGLLLRASERLALRWMFIEKDRQEALLRASGLDYTIVRPTTLTNGPAEGYIARGHLRAGLFTHISRFDVAKFLLDEATRNEWVRQAVTVSHPSRPLTDWARYLGSFVSGR